MSALRAREEWIEEYRCIVRLTKDQQRTGIPSMALSMLDGIFTDEYIEHVIDDRIQQSWRKGAIEHKQAL